MTTPTPLTYRDAGVDIDAGNELVERIKPLARKTMREVVLPQAFRSAIPPLGSVQIAMFKNSAVAGAFGIGGDLYSVGKTLTSARGFEYIPVLTGVAIGYLIITLSAGLALGLLERKVAIAR